MTIAFSIETPSSAETALDYLNGFHDAFIKELTLRSHDRFPERGVQITTGELDLALLFGHYNYGNGEPPADRLVQATFRHVKDIAFRTSELSHEWSVDGVAITPGRRQTDFGDDEDCLCAVLTQHVLTIERIWARDDTLTFTFMHGVIEHREAR